MIQMVLLLPVVWLFLCDFGPELGMGRASFFDFSILISV